MKMDIPPRKPMSLAANGRAIALFGLGVGLSLLGPRAAHAPPPPIAALAPVETLLDGRRELVGVAVEANGTTYVSDRAAGSILRLTAGSPTAVAGSGLARPTGLALDESGRLLIPQKKAGPPLPLA